MQQLIPPDMLEVLKKVTQRKMQNVMRGGGVHQGHH
jgi:hypothetical protein